MPRFFVDKADIGTDTASIRGDDVNHIRKVLRCHEGDILTLCDGNGMDYEARVSGFEKERVLMDIIRKYPSRTEPHLNVILFQGIPKSDKMDFIIQKNIELGVRTIVPVITEHTVVRIENEKDAGNKGARWNRIALEASKQCNRGIIPNVLKPMEFHEALSMAKNSQLRLIPYEKEFENDLKGYIRGKDIQDIALFVGPEGGFSSQEVVDAMNSGVFPVTLGPRILRSETAGFAVLAILMYELGDVGNG